MANGSVSSNKLWQKKLLPFMMFALIVLTVAFVGISFWEFQNFKARLDDASKKHEELLRVMSAADDPIKDTAILSENKEDGMAYIKWRSRVLIERETISRRYNITDTILFAQVLIKYFGFLTGMILAVVGAVFVLGKLQEEMSDLSGEGAGVKVSLKSASPGIILAVLGTALLITTMVVPGSMYVTDENIYLGNKPAAAEQNKPAETNQSIENMPEKTR